MIQSTINQLLSQSSGIANKIGKNVDETTVSSTSPEAAPKAETGKVENKPQQKQETASEHWKDEALASLQQKLDFAAFLKALSGADVSQDEAHNARQAEVTEAYTARQEELKMQQVQAEKKAEIQKKHKETFRNMLGTTTTIER